MSEKGSNGSSSDGQKVLDALPKRRRRPSWPLVALAVLFVVVPFLTWYLTWFGRPLSDDDITKNLGDRQSVRRVQQALTQVEERIEKGDQGAKRWYPQIVALAESPVAEVRKTVAWVMGQDNGSEEFHAGLRKLVADPHPAVRRNAAVQLIRFKDTAGLAELRAMLVPFDVQAPAEGSVTSVLGAGGEVNENALVARITDAQNQEREVRSPLHGKIVEVKTSVGARVGAGGSLLTIGPDAEFVYEALRALFLVGESEDLKEVERYAQGVEGMPPRVKEQAAQTAKAIRARSESKESSRQ
jgi:hypothetical protein